MMRGTDCKVRKPVSPVVTKMAVAVRPTCRREWRGGKYRNEGGENGRWADSPGY